MFVRRTCAGPSVGCRGRKGKQNSDQPRWPPGAGRPRHGPARGLPGGGPLTARLPSRVSLALGQRCPECGQPLGTWGGHWMPSERLCLLVSRSWGSADAPRGGCWPEVTGSQRAVLRGECGACDGRTCWAQTLCFRRGRASLTALARSEHRVSAATRRGLLPSGWLPPSPHLGCVLQKAEEGGGAGVGAGAGGEPGPVSAALPEPVCGLSALASCGPGGDSWLPAGGAQGPGRTGQWRR